MKFREQIGSKNPYWSIPSPLLVNLAFIVIVVDVSQKVWCCKKVRLPLTPKLVGLYG